MSDLATFLLARIVEDEEAARAAVERNGATWSTGELQEGARITGTTEFGNPRSYRGDGELWDDEGALGMFEETAAHIARHDPARVLAECKAKRRIMELAEGPINDLTWIAVGADTTDPGDTDVDQKVLRLLALPFADHPDYRTEWAL